uniref:Histone deacetylase 14 n=1 Tax=Tanacetum cinerariifolium TaxID=118510 RepID=A0A699IZQ1_TANCI|nr:hypothetical protein [Tanacetum cinerariifolium]
MPIPNELISNNIRNAPYYNAYLEMVGKHDRKVIAEKKGKKKTASAKQPKLKPATPPKPKLAKEKSTKTTPRQKADKAQSKPEPKLKHQRKSGEDDMDCASQMSLELFQAQSQSHVGGVVIREPVAEAIQPLPVVEGKGKAIVTEKQAAHSLLALHTPKRRSTTDKFIFQRRTLAIEAGAASEKNNSGGDTEILQINEEQGKDVDEQVVMNEDQAGPHPKESRGALAGPDLEPTHDEFMADLYLKIQESLKFLADEHAILEDPISSTATLSSMKNLEDLYAIGDQFINDKSTEDEPKKPNAEAEVVSMVTVPIYQASSLVPPLSTPIPVIDLSLPKPASSTTQALIFTATTKTTTTLPPPSQQQSTTKLESRVFTLKLRDLPHKIDEAVRESVREDVHVALQAPLRDRFRELPEADMKEILHQRMFETSTYKSLPEHVALYEVLEASMERENREELLTEMNKSRKRRRDDQDPPSPLPDSDLSKRRRHDTDAPPSSSKQQFGPHAEQPVEDIPMPDTANIYDSEDTNSAHLPKFKQRPKWFKPIRDDEIPATPELAWVIPTSYILDAMGKIKHTQADFEGQAYEVVKAFYPNIVYLQFQMEECHKMLTDQIDWANPEGDQVRIDISKHLPLSSPPGKLTDFVNSKMKAACYLDFGLELLVPKQIWINEVCTHDISASYGISHWWFNRQKFYIDRHIADSSRKVVKTYMRILSVVSIKAYSCYVYDYLKEIALRRADYQEYTIEEKDFKNLYPSDFEDLNLLLLQGHLNHLSGSDKRMLSTAIKL